MAPQYTPTKNKDGTAIKVTDWSSSSHRSHATMVSTLKIDEERAITPSSIRTIGPGLDGRYTVHPSDSMNL